MPLRKDGMSAKEELSFDSTDVVIVGAGMVGATLALALASCEKLKVTLIDGGRPAKFVSDGQSSEPVRDNSVDGFDIRVSAITQASKRLLQNLGVWSEIEQRRVSPYQGMRVWDADGTGNITFDAADIYQQELGHIVENSAILAALHHALQQCENVTCLFERSVSHFDSSSANPQVTLDDGRVISCQLVVAADGANSRLRQWANIPTREWDYQHHAIICTVETEKPHGRIARQRFLDTGPLAFLPLFSALPQDRFCSIVWSASPDFAKNLMQLDDDEFSRTLESAFESQLGKTKAVSKRVSIPLRQRHAKHYIKSGFALVGDAAHTIHPLAGQGVNLGFADSMVLAEELIKGANSGVSLGDTRILGRFERRRQGSNLAMMGLMEGFKRLFAADDVSLRWLRNTGLKLFDQSPFIKKELISQAMGGRIRVPEFGRHSCILEQKKGPV